MNKLFTTIAAGFLLCTLHAQSLAPNDSVSIGTGYANMAFYNLTTGEKTVASNTDWHLAFSVRPTPIPPGGNPLEGTTIRMNEMIGMGLSVAPRNDASTFNTLDTAGWAGWKLLHDDDSKMIEGALNSNRNLGNAFDFGWGMYNQTQHSVIGDSVYLVRLPGGLIKKLVVEGSIRDTAFRVKYANLDNSDLQQIEIRKAPYAGKNFVYLNLIDNTIYDKEPSNNAWDLQFLKYTGLNIQGQPTYSVTGVWTNLGAAVAEVAHTDVQSKDYSGQTFSTDMNVIGWDWKTFAAGGFTTTDSLIYFVRTKQSKYFKVVFTGFGGSSTGTFKFYKEALNLTGIEELNGFSWSVYPNPANNQLLILNEKSMDAVQVYDLMGNLVQSIRPMTADVQLQTHDLANGVYLLAVTSQGSTAVKRIVISH